MDHDKVAVIASELDKLPPRDRLTKAATLAALAPALRRLRERGYAIDEIRDELRRRGIEVGSRTIARALAAPATRQPRTRKRAQGLPSNVSSPAPSAPGQRQGVTLPQQR